MLDSIMRIAPELGAALGQTAFMCSVALAAAVVVGGALGILLYVTGTRLFVKNVWVNRLVGAVLNVVRSIPFLILLIFLLPLSSLIVGTKIGSEAVVVPLSIAAIAFFARLSETSFAEVDGGMLEAAFAACASKTAVVLFVLLPEARIPLIKGITITAISILGFSAMAGIVGGGGLGDLAYRYGYQRYQADVMVSCIAVLIVLVQAIQLLGDAWVARAQKMR